MQRRNLLLTAIVVLVLTTVIAAWNRPSTASAPEDSCQESMESAEKTDAHSSRLSFETLPGQFFSRL
jgi:hypothetical protein